MTASPGGGPVVFRKLLGLRLRQLRKARHATMADAALAIGASASKISRMEAGHTSFRESDVAGLLTFYGVAGEQERSALQDLARGANEQGWWHDFSGVVAGWFEAYVGLEAAASMIRTYELQFVPGLLQSEDYARAVIMLGHPAAPAHEVERRVRLRLARQELLAQQRGPHLWAVLDEAALRRPIGRPGVMRGQLKSLVEAADRPNVTVQVVPFRAGGHAAAGGPFSILRFTGAGLPDLVYLEQLTSALYLNKREVVDLYMAVMDRLCMAAEPPTVSRRILADLLREA